MCQIRVVILIPGIVRNSIILTSWRRIVVFSVLPISQTSVIRGLFYARYLTAVVCTRVGNSWCIVK